MKISRYAKTIVAALTPVFVVAQATITDNEVTSAEWAAIVVALVAAVGVWATPNTPKAGGYRPSGHVPEPTDPPPTAPPIAEP